MIKIHYLLAILAANFLINYSYKPEAKFQKSKYTLDNSNTLMGNPSNAGTSSIENFLLDRKYFSLSYSATRNIPNWVSWHIDLNDIGSTDRQNNFHSDTELPHSWYKVNESSYTGSGFDRGHNCPSADRTKSTTANSTTFLMTNMIPQAPNHNRKTWAKLEDYIRELVKSGNEAYIIMGNYGKGGTGSKGYASSISSNRITVPARIWKVILLLPEGTNDLNRINGKTRVIAVDTPNINSIDNNWKLYRTSVDAIEKATGYDLFSNIPESIQKTIEVKIDKE
jgi:endonuclease G